MVSVGVPSAGSSRMNGDIEMNAWTRRGRNTLAIVAVLVGALALTAGASARTVVYNNIVEPLPGNFASIGFEATSTAEFGGEVGLTPGTGKSPKVTVVMSAWACQEGNFSQGETCRTPKPKKTFKYPLTLNIYSVGAGNAVGSLLGTATKEFKMPYRPSTSFACTQAGDPGAWSDAAAPGVGAEKCFHGLAFPVTFKPSVSAPLPEHVIISVAYNTSTYGAHPVGAAPCQSTSEGCYYDSLNVAIIEPSEGGATVGSYPNPDEIYVNSNYNEMYCGSSATLNTFGPSGACWVEEQPEIKVEAK
jgi:hypothetical protein